MQMINSFEHFTLPEIEEIKRRFWDKTNIHFAATDEDCWDWIGATIGRGYGYMYIGRTRVAAHRVVYMLYRGQIPEGLYLGHTCDCPACINPSHLFPCNQQQNIDDCIKKKRFAVRASDAQCLEIKELAAQGLTLGEIRIKTNFALSRSQTHKIMRGKARRYLDKI